MAPLANDPIMSGTSIWSFRHLKHQNLFTGDDFIYSSGINFLVPFLATREAVVPLANDPFMSGTSIRSFRHLKHQILSTGDYFTYSSGMIFLVPFLATREAVVPLANDPIMSGTSIWSFRHPEHQNLSSFYILLTEQDVARSLVQILATKEALAPLANNSIMSG